MISNNVAFWHVHTQTSLWSLLLSLETPNLILIEYAKALIRLCVCAGWSEPLLVAHTTLLEIPCSGSNMNYSSNCINFLLTCPRTSKCTGVWKSHARLARHRNFRHRASGILLLSCLRTSAYLGLNFHLIMAHIDSFEQEWNAKLTSSSPLSLWNFIGHKILWHLKFETPNTLWYLATSYEWLYIKNISIDSYKWIFLLKFINLPKFFCVELWSKITQ